MKVAGIDYSSFAIDVVTIDIDTQELEWNRWKLSGKDNAFDRTRSVPQAMPAPTSMTWDDVLAIGIEEPAGRYGVGPLLRIQGAILSRLPVATLVHPYVPARWRVQAGLHGHALKAEIRDRSLELGAPEWAPQDAHDAHLIARAMLRDIQAQDKAA